MKSHSPMFPTKIAKLVCIFAKANRNSYWSRDLLTLIFTFVFSSLPYSWACELESYPFISNLIVFQFIIFVPFPFWK